jgi:hypothetical protein
MVSVAVTWGEAAVVTITDGRGAAIAVGNILVEYQSGSRPPLLAASSVIVGMNPDARRALAVHRQLHHVHGRRVSPFFA